MYACAFSQFSLVVAATLHVSEEKVVTLRHMVVRLLGPDYGGRTEAATKTAVQAAAEGEEAGDETLALWSEWDPDSGADVSAKLLVAHFTVSDVSLELQSLGDGQAGRRGGGRGGSKQGDAVVYGMGLRDVETEKARLDADIEDYMSNKH